MIQLRLMRFKPRLIYCLVFISTLFIINACDDDVESPKANTDFTGVSKQFKLQEVLGSKISGTVTFLQKKSGSTAVIIRLNGTPAGASHPAHIHKGIAADGPGDIVFDLNSVDGNTGTSETEFPSSQVTYEQLIAYDGYVNVHKSASELGTLIAQGDIGKNELSETSKTYNLDSLGASGLKGTAKFTKRVNGTALITLTLTKPAAGAMYPAHIHSNSAVETGPIIIPLKDVNGTTGISMTDIKNVSYDSLMNFDGYINVHKSMAELANVISQSDIGGNEITATNKTYTLGTKAVPGINGTARFDKRKNGRALVTLALKGTPAGGMHPAHIHFNSAVEGGDIAIDLATVDGTSGKSKTTVRKMNNGTAISYDSLMNFDGYINVHESMANLGTIVAQGDIGGNELTGNKKDYPLKSVAIAGANGTARFEERKNGATLITLTVSGTTAGNMHPAHIHSNSAAETGPIVIDLKNVDGSLGISMTNVEATNAGAKIKYADLLTYDGYINVHESMANLGVIVTQGDIGGNELTGTSKTYTLVQKDVPGVSGNAKFEERKNGATLITLTVSGTTVGGIHPAHIHMNAISKGGDITISLKDVAGATGKSTSNVEKFNDAANGTVGAAVKYSDLIKYNGYIDIHESMANPTKVLAQGDIGSNVL